MKQFVDSRARSHDRLEFAFNPVKTANQINT